MRRRRRRAFFEVGARFLHSASNFRPRATIRRATSRATRAASTRGHSYITRYCRRDRNCRQGATGATRATGTRRTDTTRATRTTGYAYRTGDRRRNCITRN